MNEYSTTDTSSFLIYQVLKKSKHPLLKKFEVQFPSDGWLDQESNAICILEGSEEFDKKTSDTTHYKALTEIYIKTKKSDYEEVSKLLRTTKRVIRDVLSSDEELKKRYIIFRNSSAKYGSKFSLKARNMLVQTNEIDFDEIKDDDYSEFNVFFEDVEVNE